MAMSWQVGLYVAAILIPLGSAIVLLASGRRLGAASAWVATGAVAASFVLSLVGAIAYFGQARGYFGRLPQGTEALTWAASAEWVRVGAGGAGRGLTLPVGLAIDNLAALMFLMVTFVATVVHVYAAGFLRGDPRFARFFASSRCSASAMLGLVAAPTCSRCSCSGSWSGSARTC